MSLLTTKISTVFEGALFLEHPHTLFKIMFVILGKNFRFLYSYGLLASTLKQTFLSSTWPLQWPLSGKHLDPTFGGTTCPDSHCSCRDLVDFLEKKKKKKFPDLLYALMTIFRDLE